MLEHLEMARVFMQNHDYLNALELLRRIIENPNSPDYMVESAIFMSESIGFRIEEEYGPSSDTI